MPWSRRRDIVCVRATTLWHNSKHQAMTHGTMVERQTFTGHQISKRAYVSLVAVWNCGLSSIFLQLWCARGFYVSLPHGFPRTARQPRDNREITVKFCAKSASLAELNLRVLQKIGESRGTQSTSFSELNYSLISLRYTGVSREYQYMLYGEYMLYIYINYWVYIMYRI